MTRILVKRLVAETRAVAFDSEDVPISCFIQRETSLDPSATYGDVFAAIVRTVDKRRQEAFVELETGELAFFNLSPKHTPPAEGEHINVEIRAEAYGDKKALVRPTGEPAERTSREDRLRVWMSAFEGSDVEDWSEMPTDDIEQVLTEALSTEVTISGGGRLSIETTRAMTVVDVDTAGWSPRQGAVNPAALTTLAREISLRRISGLVAIDLAGAPKGVKAKALRDHMSGELNAYRLGRADVLPPSAFGVMEISIQRRLRPLREYSPETCAVDRRETEMVAACLRQAEEAAASARTAKIAIMVTPNFAEKLGNCRFNWETGLAQRYGTRFDLQIKPNLKSAYEIQVN